MLGGSEMATLREIELMQSLERRDARILELERELEMMTYAMRRVISIHIVDDQEYDRVGKIDRYMQSYLSEAAKALATKEPQ